MAGAVEVPDAEVERRRAVGQEASRCTDDEGAASARNEQAPVCTTLCLWEPDAALMIRKAQGQERARRSEYAAEARKGGFAEAASESGVSAEIRAFEAFFAVELRAARDTMEQVMEQQAPGAETPKLFDWWHEQLRELHSLVSGAANYLPTQLREKFVRQIGEHETRLKAERERLTPKKKFGFKNRSKVGKGPAVAPATDATQAPAAAVAGGAETPAALDGAAAAREAASPTGGGVAHLPKADTFQAPAGCHGFRNQSGGVLVRPAGEPMESDFALENLDGCEVRLLSASTVLWIRGLRRCTVFALPVKGSIYITSCEQCTLVLGSRQLRIHTSSAVDFYVHTSSHPIIEHCSALRFAPYPSLPPSVASAFAAASLDPDKNQWHLVDDFDWLKATHSPNWAELPEAERVRPAALEAL